jgi:hypothetical protein
LAKLNLNLPLLFVIYKFTKEKGFSRCYAWRLLGIRWYYATLWNQRQNKSRQTPFKPRPAYRMQGGQSDMSSGTNAPNGVIVRYFSRRNLHLR